MNEASNFQKLLAGLPQGDVPDDAGIDRLLAACWDDLDGSDEGGMEAYKLLRRMKQVVWMPPVLTFVVKRHGSLACGSTLAELQHWEINLDKNEAQMVKEGHPQITTMAESKPVKATADEIARLILAGQDDERLARQDDGTVKVLARRIYPEGSGYKRTVQGQRRRLCQYIENALVECGWGKLGWNVFSPPNEPAGERAGDLLTRWAPTSTSSHKDIGVSQKVAVLVSALPKQCWFNCRRAVEGLDEFAEASYVEGWALGENCPAYEHAWLVLDGKIIDPTLPDSSLTYFPGLEFRGRAEIEAFLRTPRGRACRKSPFFYAFGWGGQNSPSFRRCYEQAQKALVERHGLQLPDSSAS